MDVFHMASSSEDEDDDDDDDDDTGDDAAAARGGRGAAHDAPAAVSDDAFSDTGASSGDDPREAASRRGVALRRTLGQGNPDDIRYLRRELLGAPGRHRGPASDPRVPLSPRNGAAAREHGPAFSLPASWPCSRRRRFLSWCRGLGFFTVPQQGVCGGCDPGHPTCVFAARMQPCICMCMSIYRGVRLAGCRALD